MVSYVADAPVHVAGGAQHDVRQPVIHSGLAVHQLMRNDKAKSALGAQA